MDLISYSIYILVLFGVSSVKCDVLAYTQSTNQTIKKIASLSAGFGPPLPSNGLEVLAVNGIPMDGCGPMENAPTNHTYLNTTKFVVVIVRGNCSFVEKVRNAQIANFDAVIVYNKDSNNLKTMSAANDSDIFIPSVFVGETTGKIIKLNYQFTKGFVLVLKDIIPMTHLTLPLCAVAGSILIILLSFMVVEYVRERRSTHLYPITTISLKKLEFE